MPGARSFDGLRVEETLARLAGTFAVDSNDAELLVADQTVVAVVVARVSGAAEKIMRSGVVRRTNVLDVNQFAIVREPALQQMLVQHLPQLDSPVTEIPEPALTAWQDSHAVEKVIAESEQWVPPKLDNNDEWLEAKPLARPEPEEEEEVFTPGDNTMRSSVGGARRNDRVLARFLEGRD